MSTWLLEGELSALLFLVLLPLLVVPFLAWVYRRYRYPAPESFCFERRLADYWHLRPGASLGPVVDTFTQVGLTQTVTSGVFLQVAFNVLFFLPLGFLLAYWARRGLGVAVLAGLVVSLMIEVAQGTGLWGVYPCPYRLADVDDLIMNTLGATIGWGLGRLVSRVVPFRDPSRRTDLVLPTLRRRALAGMVDVLLVVLVTLGVDVVVAFSLDARGIALDQRSPLWLALQVTVGAGLLLVIPTVRRDRATPGQITVLLGLSRRASIAPAPRWSPVVRFIVRWTPILLIGGPMIAVVAGVELITVAVRRDRRSLSAVLARSRTVTHDQLITSSDERVRV